MAKLSITFPNIHCNQITTPRDSSDHLYFVALPTLLSKAEGGQEPKKRDLAGVVSEWDGVYAGNNYRPALRGGAREILVDVPDDAQKLVLVVSMAERDDGELYSDLTKNPRMSLPTPQSWTEIEKVIPDDLTSPSAWVKNIVAVLFGFLKDALGDDVIDTQTFEIDLVNRAKYNTDYRRFQGSGGDYILNVEWRRLP